MMRRYNRLLVLFYVASDSALAMVAFILAYIIRFELLAGVFPVTKGYPPLEQYLRMLPFIQAIVPIAFYAQGLYHLRRGRTRVDDFFAVFVGTILAVVIGVGGTLYFQAYYVSDELKDAGAYEISQLVWAIFLVVNVTFAYMSRELIREALERRWKAGIGLKRVLIAGAGDLGRLVADKVLEHRELGFKVLGFIDDRAAGDHIGYRGLPLLGMLNENDPKHALLQKVRTQAERATNIVNNALDIPLDDYLENYTKSTAHPEPPRSKAERRVEGLPRVVEAEG